MTHGSKASGRLPEGGQYCPEYFHRGHARERGHPENPATSVTYWIPARGRYDGGFGGYGQGLSLGA